MLSCGTRLACRHFGGLSGGTGSLARLCNLVGKCSDLGKPTKIARQIDEQDEYFMITSSQHLYTAVDT